MDLEFVAAPGLKIPVIALRKKRPVMDPNDARVAEVNAKAGFSHSIEQAKRQSDRQQSARKTNREHSP